MLENINLALQGVWSHKLRSFLTMLGIIIGIAAIITIVSTIRGTNEQIKQNLIGAGNDMVQVQLTQDGSVVDLSYGEIPEGIATITSAMRDEMDALPGVSAVAMYHQRTWADGIYAGNNSFTGTLNGVDDHYLSVAGYQVNYGRAFLPEDFSSCRKVAVIDTAAAQSLFPGQNPIGGVIEMQGEPFTVVGVVSQRVPSQPVINSVEDYQMYARTTSGTVMIPESCWPIAFRYDEPMNVAVRASSTNDMTKAGSGVADYLNGKVVSGSKAAYQAQDLLKQASELQSLSETTNRQLIWIAAISLVVGGIGIMNIMLVSVTERTREIGIRKENRHRRPEEPHPLAVSDGGSSAYQLGRPAGRPVRHRSGGDAEPRHGYGGGHQRPGLHCGGGLLHGHRHRVRSGACRQGLPPEPHRGPAPGVSTVPKSLRRLRRDFFPPAGAFS